MSVVQTKYIPGRYGLGTEFALSSTPREYSRSFVNRFINLRGDAEKRPGMSRLGNQVSGAPTITGIHEYVDRVGNVTLLVSAAGTIWKYNTSTQNYDQVLTGKDASSRLVSVQMNDKLIFTNGVDRNFYTDDAGTTFKELKALMETGQASSTSTSAASLSDSNITNWLTQTFVTTNDLVYNATRNAYGIVTAVTSGRVDHTPISTTSTGIGVATSGAQTTGDRYEIIDLVALNIIPSLVGDDNFGTLRSGSSSTVISVSGVDFSTTEIELGDIIYNTTRAAVTNVTSVSANVNVVAVSGQTSGDSIQLFKSAMPISTWPHVHYGRLYMVDARDQSLVRISGPDDPQDFTTYQRTLEATSQQYGARQPQAERILTLKTFQQYLVAGGERNVYADSGQSPIVDTSAESYSFSPVGLFPQGCASRFAIESIGGSMVFGANDGLRNFNAVYNNQTFQTSNISEAIKTELARAIASRSSDADSIQTVHYPRRNWLLFKVGDTIYNYNYTPYYEAGNINATGYGSFSKFTGKFAQQQCYYVRKSGDFLCAGANGYVYVFDNGSYADDNEPIPTVIETGYLKLVETQESTQIKSVVYARPIFETSVPIEYNVTILGDYDQNNTDTVSFTTRGVGEVGFAVVGSSPVGGRRVNETKVPLRAKGQVFRIQFTTNSTQGPDIITGYTLYGNVLGKI